MEVVSYSCIESLFTPLKVASNRKHEVQNTSLVLPRTVTSSTSRQSFCLLMRIHGFLLSAALGGMVTYRGAQTSSRIE